MKQSRFSALWLIAALAVNIHTAAGQGSNASVQNVSSRPAAIRVVPHVAPRPARVIPRNVSSYVPRNVAQSAPNLLPNYPVVPRSLNPAVAPINAEPIRRVNGQEPISLDPPTRQRELRALAAMHERRNFAAENRTVAAINPQRPVISHDPAGQPQSGTATKWHERNDRPNFADALRHHWHEWHDRNWWHDHCDTIVFVIGGYYFLDGNYWYPAWGYDPSQTYYDYDGPVYTYGNLLPDEVIANVQTALQDAGYYFGAVTGSLNFETRTALANFQRDYGLEVTGAIDEPTVETMGLGQSEVYQTGDVSNSSY